MVGDHVEDRIEAGEDGEDGVAVLAKNLPLVQGRVGGADEVEDGRAGLGRVQVVGEGGDVIRLRLLGEGLERYGRARLERGPGQPLMEGAQALDGGGGLDEPVEGEVVLVAVGNRDEREANGGGLIRCV